MLWSVLKVLGFVALATALTYGFSLLMATPGALRLAFGGREITLAPIEFVVLLMILFGLFWLAIKLMGLVLAVLRFASGDETAISRYFDKNRERRGFDALTQGLMALAAGEGKLALAKATQAERLLDRPELTQLLNAQAALLNGNGERAAKYYKAMLTDERTRFVGVQGLLKQRLAAGDTETALRLAEKAYALRPRLDGVIDTLFDLQSKGADWAGARKTLEGKVKAGTLPREVARRRDAVLSVAEAMTAFAADDIEHATRAADAAIKQSPTLVPAATLAARLHADAGDKRGASRILRKAWDAAPHPELAAAYAALEPYETPTARQKRFRTWLAAHPDHAETRLLEAEMALAAEDFPAARRAIGKLAETAPTTRSLAIMAAIERGAGAADAVVRGWLAKALSAPRGEAWVCSACNHIHGSWVPLCSHCNALDTLAWTQPPTPDADTGGPAMLPLIVSALVSPLHDETQDANEAATRPMADDETIIDLAELPASQAEPPDRTTEGDDATDAPPKDPLGARVG